MLKKVPAIILSMLLGSSGVVFANDSITDTRDSRDEKVSKDTSSVRDVPTIESNTSEKAIDYNNEFFKNEPLSEESAKFQQVTIKKLKEKYLDAKNYNTEELNNLFTSFISLGFNEAADTIFNDKNVKIDLERYNENGWTPLMAAAVAPIKGGNVEYAKKLIDLGVNINKGTHNTDITPISLASTVNNYKVVGLLVFKGALFMKEDKLNFRPIDYALRNNSVASAQIIKEALTVRLKTLDTQHNKEEEKQ